MTELQAYFRNRVIKTGRLVATTAGNWNYYAMTTDGGKMYIEYVANDPQACGSGVFGDINYVKKMIRCDRLTDWNFTEYGRELLS